MANASILAAFERMWAHVVNALAGKAESNHEHSTADITSGTLDVTRGGTGNTSVDTTPTSGSTKMVTSGGLYTALSKKANLASPTLTGTPKAPTASAGTNTTQIATTAFVTTAVSNKQDKITGTAGQFVVIGSDGNPTTMTITYAEEGTF